MAPFHRMERGMASFSSCIEGHASLVMPPWARRRSLPLPAARTRLFGVLAQHSLVSWSSGLLNRLVAVLRSRLGCLPVVTDYFVSCLDLSHILGHSWQWMITQVSLAVAYGGSLEIHPQSF